jgi:hypothetical protein
MEWNDALLRLLDREAIEDTLVRYCRGVDRADASLIASAYHVDAVDDHGARTFAGPEIGAGIVTMTRSQRVTHHSITNVAITFHAPDVASCESYYHAWQTMEHDGCERILIAVGRYLDRFEQRNGKWRIAHRIVVVDLATFLPESNFTTAAPDRGQRGPDDPSFALLQGR